MMTLYGLRVYVSEWYVTPTWVFPQHRYMEWEEKDEKSCRTLGIGHEGPSQPAGFTFGDCLYVHPTIYAELKKQRPPSKIGQNDGVPVPSLPGGLFTF